MHRDDRKGAGRRSTVPGVTRLVGLIAAGTLVLAACGGGGGEDVTLRDFVRAGDDVCESYERDRERFQEQANEATDIDEVVALVEDDYLPSVKDQLDELRELDLPSDEDDRADVEDLLDELDDAIRELEDDVQGALESGDDPFERVNRMADDLGFKVCGSDEETEEPTTDTVPVDETIAIDTIPVETVPPVVETDPGTFGDNEQASVIAGLLAQQFTASDPTFETSDSGEQCIADQLSLIYTPESLELLADESFAFEDLAPEDQGLILQAVEDCVPSEVVAGYVTEGILEELPAMTAEQGNCISNEIISTYGVAGLVQLGELASDTPDPAKIVEVFQLMQNCMTNLELGYVLAPTILEDSPNLTEDQAACFMGGVLDVIGVEALSAFDDPDFVPTPEMEQGMVDVILGCGIDPANL